MNLTTVIYYTSNHENELFESKVRGRLREAVGEIPVISVSQKPIAFGHNICVGDIGLKELNIPKQMLAGCEQAKTPYVTFAEADTLYPPEYFRYIPTNINKRYWFEPVYILYPYSEDMQNSFYSKGRSDCAHMAGREFIVNLLRKAVSEGTMLPFRGDNRPEKVLLETPIVSLKTGNSLHPKTQTNLIPIPSSPYWGEAKELKDGF